MWSLINNYNNFFLDAAAATLLSEVVSKLPEEVREYMIPIIGSIIQNSETPEEANKTIKEFKKVAPEYIKYHYQTLHRTLHQSP